jgi:hypothetical protein
MTALKVHFKFGSPQRGGHSQLKLVMQQVGCNDWMSPHGFGGRIAPFSQKQKHFDKEKFFSIQNEELYLKEKFETHFRQKNLRVAFIADSTYPATGSIKEAYCFITNSWTTLEVVKFNLYKSHRAIYETAMQVGYTMRLWIPIFNKPKGVSFYTQKRNITDALLELIAQYQTWKKANCTARVQMKGQIYGNVHKIHDVSEREVKSYAWFDVNTMLPKYHHTHRTIVEYADNIKAHQDFEVLISEL